MKYLLNIAVVILVFSAATLITMFIIYWPNIALAPIWVAYLCVGITILAFALIIIELIKQFKG